MAERLPDMLDALLDRQKQDWTEGRRPKVDDLLHNSAFEHDSEAILDLIYNEILIREELGDQPNLDEYLQRYPQLADALKIHFDVHRAVHDKFLVDTKRLQESGTLNESAPALVEVGPNLADYELLGELGRGGMGIVYKARHRSLKRPVALKMIQPGRQPSPRELTRFRTEAETIARLQHPNIVQIFEVGQTQGLPFLALELAEQGTLAQKLQAMPLPPRAAAELIENLSRALHHAHEHHVIHRDLKPANVLFGKDGTPKITDFGLAKILADDADGPRDPTRSGEPIGTPRYMAPEQVTGRKEEIGPATDVYALGALLYECMTGQAPFVAANVMETMDKIRHEEPWPPRRLQRSIPRDLETICLKCLRKQPARRYASAMAVAEDLRRFLHGEPIHARPTPRWELVWSWSRRRPAQAALVAVVVTLLVAGATTFAVRQHAEQRRLADLRDEVSTLVQTGREAWAREDAPLAEARFEAAWSKIQAEPSLQDLQASVGSLRDHSQREAELQRQRERRRRFNELRDEALFQGILQAALHPQQKEFVPAARRSIATALALTDAEDPTWQLDREQLVLLDAGFALDEGDAAIALTALDQAKVDSSRLFHARRADCLDRLGRGPEAEQERARAVASPTQDTLDLFLNGADRFRRQDLVGAIRDLERALALQPDHFASRLFLASCLLNANRPAEAKIALTACIGQRPDFVWGYLFRGVANLQLGDLNAAKGDFQRAEQLNLDPQARFALSTNWGLLYLQQEQYSLAQTELERAARLMPQEYSAWVNLAQLFRRQKRWDAAEENLLKAIELQPASSMLYRARAASYRDQNKWALALADLDRALEHESTHAPERVADNVERARILVRLGRLDEALRASQQSILAGSGSAEAWQVQGEVLVKLERFADAVRAFDRRLALAPPTLDVLRVRGFAYMKLGDYVTAIDVYTRALALHRDAEICQHRGWAYFFADAFRLAERDFNESLKLQPDIADALLGRGLARVYRGDYGPAIGDADKAGEVASPEMEVNRACIYAQALIHVDADGRQSQRKALQQQCEEKALASLRHVLELVPKEGRASFWREKILTDSGLQPLRKLPGFQNLGQAFQ